MVSHSAPCKLSVCCGVIFSRFTDFRQLPILENVPIVSVYMLGWFDGCARSKSKASIVALLPKARTFPQPTRATCKTATWVQTGNVECNSTPSLLCSRWLDRTYQPTSQAGRGSLPPRLMIILMSRLSVRVTALNFGGQSNS